MRKWAHLVTGAGFIAALFFPVFNWTFKQAGETALLFTLKGLTYMHKPGAIVSQMDNQALFWLAIGLGVLHGALGLTNLAPLILQKLYNASALLSSALVFSLIVTAYRAEKSIIMEVETRLPCLAAWLILLAWLATLVLYFRYRKLNELRQ